MNHAPPPNSQTLRLALNVNTVLTGLATALLIWLVTTVQTTNTQLNRLAVVLEQNSVRLDKLENRINPPFKP